MTTNQRTPVKTSPADAERDASILLNGLADLPPADRAAAEGRLVEELQASAPARSCRAPAGRCGAAARRGAAIRPRDIRPRCNRYIDLFL